MIDHIMMIDILWKKHHTPVYNPSVNTPVPEPVLSTGINFNLNIEK